WMRAAAQSDAGHPSHPPPWLILLGAAFAGYYVLLLFCDLTRPEPMGVTVDIVRGDMIVKSVAPGSPAARSGLAVGDRVTTANGHLIHGRLDWLLVEMNLGSGEPLRLDVARRSSSFAPTLTLSRAPPAFWLTHTGASLMIARGGQLVTLLVAFM